MPHMNGPGLDQAIDLMLTSRDANEGKDPLDPGPFPSLGFANERGGSYYLQIRSDDDNVMVTIWRSGQEFDISTYIRKSYNGIEQWGSDGTKVHCEDLIQVQMAVHHLFTSGGKIDATR